MQDYNQSNGNNFINKWWRSIDQQMIIALMVLFAFSLMLVTTSSSFVAARIGLIENYFASRQVMYLIGALGIIILFSSISKNWIKRIAIIGFLVNTLLLLLVRFYGYEVKGALRWISIFGFSIQPSEFIKPFFAVVIGWILSLKSDDDFPSFSTSLVLYAIVSALLIIQPDFGMWVMITLVFGTQLFVAGIPFIWILLSLCSAVFGIITAYFLLPHVANRVNSFLDPSSSENYQVSKSIMAFEHGGLYGRGPGEGSIKQILPDSHTDFIFAVAGEEFGGTICLVIIAVFAFIVLRALIRLLNEDDKFLQLASIGIITQFGLQSIINIGVTLNMLPTKGMTLPFISYGGSSTLAIAMAMGILLSFTKKQTSLIRYKLKHTEVML